MSNAQKHSSETDPEQNHPAPGMSFMEHLVELRLRLIRSTLAVVLCFCVAYAFSKTLFQWLRYPFDQAYQQVYGEVSKLQNIHMLEGFVVYLKVGALGGVMLSLPFVFYQMLQFILPALNQKEKAYLWPLVAFGTLFFLGGAAFGYGIVFPQSFSFLLSVTKGELILQNIRMEDYFKFASMLLLGFGVAFELPLIIFLLVMADLVTPKQLLGAWRGVLIGILGLSAILTPADIPSMMLMAGPLFVLYLATVGICMLFVGSKKETDV